ncbi:MAG: Cupin 2 conserved barrel domain protein [Bacteroidetes bacterium]|jgi:mannose-6-phosphate isomerase-like protein (cupin superfamily)|nr:Cupin 2 conserved barrel domain protein [Bacteroidota bacterium]MDF2452822.1 Cupin 2 conserved barrel domain protein [Bacteroidota bacterium]
MAKTNQIIENPILGDKAKFLITAEDSNGELMRGELWLKPLAQGPPLHYHPIQSETFEVVKGKLGLEVDGKKMLLGPGEKYTIQPNTSHKWFNAGDEELHMFAELRPALKTEFFLESMYSLACQGKVNKEGLPGTLQFAALLNECPGELYIVGPPIPAQKFMAKFVGGFAKLIGYKGFVPFPKN